MLHLSLLPLAILLVAAAGQPPQFNQGGDQYKQLQEQLRPSYRLNVPSISGPAPLILLVSGCSGFSPPNYADRARRLVASGHAVAYVDYLRARNLNDACDASRASIGVADIGEFVVAAAADLQQDPRIDRNRVFVVGWSLGGGGVLSAMNAVPLGRSPITAAAALYPACRGVSPWNTPVPTLLLLGDLDNIQPPELCHALVKAVGLSSVHVRSYARAHHAFDAIELPTVIEATSEPTVGYNPDAAAAAWDAILDFFRRSAA